ncbi:MAG: ABC transporter substrate-binding protein [Rhizobiales bacterium]|nr:ABC transporter substrate-binding protein [Hyphomicrobiales bacterium]
MTRPFTRRNVLHATAGASLALVAAPAIRAQPRPIKIGMLQPMSGGMSTAGKQGQPAFEHVVRLINASGGIRKFGGAPVELVLADDATQPGRTATEARRLITQERVAMLSGLLHTPASLALAPVVDELKVPALSIGAGVIKANYQYSLGLPFERGYAQPTADFIAYLNRERGFAMKTAVMAFSNYEAGQQINTMLKPRLKEIGVEILDEVALDTRGQDHTAAMLRIRAKRPDLVIGFILPRDGVLLQQARHSLAYHDPVFFSPGYGDISFWHDLSPEVGQAVLTRNLFALVSISPDTKIPALQALIADLGRQPQVQMTSLALLAAQAARVMQVALEAAEAPEPEAIHQALARVHLQPGDPHLYLASPDGIRFGADRMMTTPYSVMVQWRPDKSQDVVYPAAFAGTTPRPRAAR